MCFKRPAPHALWVVLFISVGLLTCACSPVKTGQPGPFGPIGPGGPNDGGAGYHYDFAVANSTPDLSSSSTGFTAYCGQDSTVCTCGAPASSYTAGAACGADQVGSPSLCCAIADWPGPTSDETACVCLKISCTESVLGDFCSCSGATADPSQGDKPVSSCTGRHCCVTPSQLAPMCACWTSDAPCQSGDIAVSSCDTSSPRCDGKQVSACN